MLRYGLAGLQLVVLVVAGALGPIARDPALAASRPWPLAGAVTAAAIALLIAALAWRGRTRLRMAAALAAALALAFALSSEARFQLDRRRVLAADADALAEIGRHLIVGYRSAGEVLPLIERGAIGGVFLSAKNVSGRSAEAIAAEIAGLQAVQARHGRPPLWVAADQEGGLVSRLSPPLPRQPALRTIAVEPEGARGDQVAAFARRQAAGLARLGVNLNFAPVVDLDFAVVDPSDRYTRITERAIGRDPRLVAEVAGRYCEALAEAGVRCTLKHFPGLGRVRGDTHVAGADLEAGVAALEDADWVPFRSLAAGPDGPATMLAHVRLPPIDPDRPASVSRPVVAGLLRGAWRHQGLLVTDDLCMGAIYYGDAGLRAGAVDALAAGVDLLLVSWDGAQAYKVLSALLSARRDGRLDPAVLAASRARLDAARR